MKRYLELIKKHSRGIFLFCGILMILIIELVYKDNKLKEYELLNKSLTETIQTLNKEIENHRPYKYLQSKIDNWVIEEKYQQLMFDFSKRYSVDYILILSLCYMEGTRNNVYKSNGVDYGLMQINETNVLGLRELTGSENLELLYDPEINIAMACRIVKHIFQQDEIINTDIPYWWACVHYNGGMTQVMNIKNKTYTKNCMAGKYATNCLIIYDILRREYETGYITNKIIR